jgi:hypothetical protein
MLQLPLPRHNTDPNNHGDPSENTALLVEAVGQQRTVSDSECHLTVYLSTKDTWKPSNDLHLRDPIR